MEGRSSLSRMGRLGALGAGLVLVGASAAHAGWSVSIGTGFVFGGGCGGWGGPVVSIGTTWSSGGCGSGWYSPCYGRGYYGGGYYGGGYCGNGWGGGGWGYPCSSYYAPRPYCAPSYPTYSSCGSAYASTYSPAVTAAAAVRIAEAPRPVAPVAPPETNVARGWRLMEADNPGAMEAFGKAVARSESADAYLGYAICAARAGQNGRAEWAARTALRKDGQVLAKAPAGKGVKAAADAALTQFARSAPGADDGRWFTVAVLSTMSGDAQAASSAATRLAGVDQATSNLRAAVGGQPEIVASAESVSDRRARAAAVAASVLGPKPTSTAKPVATALPARRVVVALKPDTK